MHDETLMRELYGRADLPEQFEPCGHRQCARIAVRGEWLSLDVLHREVRMAIHRHTAVEQPREVRMFQRRENLSLAAEATHGRLAHRLRTQELHRDALAELIVVARGFVHGAHATDADAPRDLVDADAPAETSDGHAVALRANVEFREELPLLGAYGAQGVGLFRTEMLFLTQGRALDEAQQLDVYRDAVRHAAPYPVTFRLVDLGGDKVLPLSSREANPFLGWRGIRILIDKPDLLRPQLRAILRAAADAPDGAPPQILLPMVSTLEEVRAVRRSIRDVETALAAEGARFRAGLPLGIMVEVPAVALLADRFAAEVDFFSVGTNDLTQFTLAVDRGNDLVAGLYRALHPAVLSLVAATCEAARRAGKTVSVCGELAADPRATPLLVGLGVDALSASPAALGFVRRVLRSHTLPEARQLAQDALAQSTAAGVQDLLDDFLALHNRDLSALIGDAADVL